MHDLDLIVSLEQSLLPGCTTHDGVIELNCDLVRLKRQGGDELREGQTFLDISRLTIDVDAQRLFPLLCRMNHTARFDYLTLQLSPDHYRSASRGETRHFYRDNSDTVAFSLN